jgi:hypothetical protein
MPACSLPFFLFIVFLPPHEAPHKFAPTIFLSMLVLAVVVARVTFPVRLIQI